MLQQCEKQLSVLNITLLRKQAEMEVSRNLFVETIYAKICWA